MWESASDLLRVALEIPQGLSVTLLECIGRAKGSDKWEVFFQVDPCSVFTPGALEGPVLGEGDCLDENKTFLGISEKNTSIFPATALTALVFSLDDKKVSEETMGSSALREGPEHCWLPSSRVLQQGKGSRSGRDVSLYSASGIFLPRSNLFSQVVSVTRES